MRGRKSSPRASSSRTCACCRVASRVRENESKSAGDRVCPANRKPRKKVKKRKKRGGALAHATCEKRASNNALRRFYAHTGARYANCFRPDRTLNLALYAQYARFASHTCRFRLRRADVRRKVVSRLMTDCNARIEIVTLIPRRYFTQ